MKLASDKIVNAGKASTTVLTTHHYFCYRSFAPFWLVLKTLVEKLSNIHQQLMLSWQELIREVHKHNNDQQKRHREVC